MKNTILVIFVLLLVGTSLSAEMRPATKLVVGETAHFSLERNGQEDFSIQLGKGSYYIIWDGKFISGKPGSLIGVVQLLKSNGSIVNSMLLNMSEVGAVARVGKKFQIPKPLAARLRVLNKDEETEMWITVLPAAKMKFIPFGFENGNLKPLAIGTEEGKGGTLDTYEWAYHSIKLPAGKYDVSLYLKRVDGKNSSVIGSLDRFDGFGFRIFDWNINVSELGSEARKDKQLILSKPQTVIFRVSNPDAPVDYIIGIEKSTD